MILVDALFLEIGGSKPRYRHSELHGCTFSHHWNLGINLGPPVEMGQHSVIICWLVVWIMSYWPIYIYENNTPNWLRFFRGVETTNQSKYNWNSFEGLKCHPFLGFQILTCVDPFWPTTGGLKGYLQRARSLLKDAQAGTNPFAAQAALRLYMCRNPMVVDG